MSLITLLTDFGLTDYYVAAVKGTLLRLAPGATLVDLSHDIPPGDVAAGAHLLAGAVPTFPAGAVHLAVVDPGVGSARRVLAVEADFGFLVGPDNGLLTPFLDGARSRAVERRELFLPAPGATFHGRDRFAPVAAYLARGGEAARLGPEIPDAVRLPGEAPKRRRAGKAGHLAGRVAHVDRFGNLITDIPSAWLAGPLREVRAGEHRVTRRVSHYAELAAGEAGLLAGSRGTLELSLNGESISRRWGIHRGCPVTVTFELEWARAESFEAINGGLKESDMTKWEYKIINIRSENYRLDPNAAPQLNVLGEEGWELISITSVNFKTGATDNIAMVFKRPVGG